MSKIEIDKEKCIGCGTCAGLCPEVFKVGQNNKAQVINPQGRCNLKEAAESCPTQSISVSS